MDCQRGALRSAGLCRCSRACDVPAPARRRERPPPARPSACQQPACTRPRGPRRQRKPGPAACQPLTQQRAHRQLRRLRAPPRSSPSSCWVAASRSHAYRPGWLTAVGKGVTPWPLPSPAAQPAQGRCPSSTPPFSANAGATGKYATSAWRQCVVAAQGGNVVVPFRPANTFGGGIVVCGCGGCTAVGYHHAVHAGKRRQQPAVTPAQRSFRLPVTVSSTTPR